MAKDLLVDMIALAGKYAYSVMVEMQQDMMPAWLYISDDGAHVVATPWGDQEEKELVVNQMGRVMRKANARAYSLIVEAWSARAPEGWDPDKDPLPKEAQPRHRADRIETVIAFATDGELIEWKRWHTIRDWNERVIRLEELSDEGALPEGWMTQLLKKKK